MPLATCPITEVELAEFALGAGRGRLDAATFDKVAAHVAVCRDCRRDYADYLEKAEFRFTPSGQVDAAGNPYSREHLDATRNVITRFQASLTVRAAERTRALMARRWRRRLALATTAAAGAAVVFLSFRGVFGVSGGDSASLSKGAVAHAPNPSIVDSRSSPPPLRPSRAFVEAEDAESRAMTQALADRMAALETELETEPMADALTRLAKERERVQSGTAAEAEYAWAWLVRMHENLVARAKGTPEEGPMRLALSRTLLQAGWLRESADAFDRHIAVVGETARTAAREAGRSPAEIALGEQVAKADAYYAEVRRLYEAHDHAAALELARRLLIKYPTSAKAYEGQVIAARCFIANQQPAEAVSCYRRIVEGSPDERFARETAKSLILMLSASKRHDETAEACRAYRKRFTDDDFRMFALLEEGGALREKGARHYPAALSAWREVRAIGPDSSYAETAAAWTTVLRRRSLSDVMNFSP